MLIQLNIHQSPVVWGWKHSRLCVYRPPKRREGRRHLSTVAQREQCCLWKVFIFPWISYSLVLKVTAVCNLWQKASSFFGSGSLTPALPPTLGSIFLSNCHYLLNLFHVIIDRCLFLEFLRTKCDDTYIHIYIYETFLKHGIESHMVMISECQTWFFFSSFFFFLKPYLFLWAVNSLQTHQRECVLDQGDFFFLDHIIASCGVYD